MSEEKNKLDNEQNVQNDEVENNETEAHAKLAEMDRANLEAEIERLKQLLEEKEHEIKVAVSNKAVELAEEFRDKQKSFENSLNEQETTIQKLQSENSRLTDARDELQNNNATLEKALDTLKNTVTDQKQTITDLQVEKESLLHENKALVEENKSYQKSTLVQQKSLENLDQYKKQTEAATNKVKELEAELEKMKTLHSDIDTSETPSATFRIDIYKRQEEYNGKIIHTISQDKKAFHTIDPNIIASFIMDHLPKIEDQNDVPKMAAARQESPSDKIAFDFNVRSSELKPDQPFDIFISVDKGAKTEDLNKLGCIIDFYARNMYSGSVTKILSKQAMPSTDKELSFVEKAHPLPPGTFRLEGAVFFRSKDGKPTQHLAKSPERFVTVE